MAVPVLKELAKAPLKVKKNSQSDVAALSPATGRPLDLDIDVIDEDPNQPRSKDNPGFSLSSLAELAETIRLRGVKTPISVRDSPDAPGSFIINHGARRFRASKLSGMTTVPGFIDNDYNDADQVIENLQRNELTAREIADYIGRDLAKGLKKGEIAKAIGKSAAFVSQHVVLLDLPAPIATAFNKGRVRDVTVINELVKTFRLVPPDVAAWLNDEAQDITRGSVKELREFLHEKLGREQAGEGDNYEDAEAPVVEVHSKTKAAGRPSKQEALKSPVVHVKFNKRLARLLLSRRPSSDGLAWLRCDDDGKEIEVDLVHVRLVALRERE
jgi:ParB family chromosome partitioning protein